MWVAANSRPAIERAPRLGDRWFVNPHAAVSEITGRKAFYDERKDGDTSVPVFREAFVAETTEAAREIARTYLEPKYERYIEWGQDEAMEGRVVRKGSYGTGVRRSDNEWRSSEGRRSASQ